MDPIGIRNNNPGNIRASGIDWEGAVGEEGGFVKFDGPVSGGKALVRNLMAYNTKYGLNTVEGIIGRWAPPTENDTGSYVAAVAVGLGVEPNAPLDMRSPQVLGKLASLISRHENAGDRFEPGFFDTVAESAVQGTAVDPLTKAYIDTAKQPKFTKAVARAEALRENAPADLQAARGTDVFAQQFPASVDGPALYEADAQRLAQEQVGVSFTESVMDSLVHNTVTAKIAEIAQRGEYDPSFDPMSEENKQRSIRMGIYGNDQLMDYVNAARNAQDFSERLETAQERMDIQRRMGNLQGLDFASAIAGQLIGGVADPVTVITTMGLGAAVASARGAAAAGRALSIAKGAGVAAAENAAVGQVLEQADNQRFSWGTLFEQGITGAAFGTVGGLLVGADGRVAADPGRQPVKPEAAPVLTAAARAVESVVDSNVNRAWEQGQVRSGGYLGESRVDNSISTNYDDLTTYTVPTLGRVRVNPLDEARARVLDKQIEALEAERAELTPDTAAAAGRGEVRSARQELRDIEGREPTAADRKALTRAYQDRGMKFKEALARADKELDAKSAELTAQAQRVQDGIASNARAEQAGQRMQQVDVELAALRKERESVNAPLSSRLPLAQALDTVFAVRREARTLTPPPRKSAAPEGSTRADTYLRWLAAEAVDPLVRALAGRLREQRIMSAAIRHDTPENIAKATGGRGTAYYDADTATVWVPHSAPEHVVLHEIAHAATADAIHLGRKHPTSTTGQLVTELEELRAAMQRAHGNSTDKLTRAYLGDLDEFVAGLYSGNSDFIQRLRDTSLRGASLLSRAVQIVRSLLGIDPSETNALLKALDLADQLVDAAPADRATGIRMFQDTNAQALPLSAREQIIKDSLEAVGEDLDPSARATAERGQKMLEHAPTWFDKGMTWAYSPGVVLSKSKSRITRIAGSVLFENSLGSGKRTSTVSMAYEMLQRGYRDPYLMSVREDMVSLMSAKERADYSFLGGARKAVARISSQVAEERARRRLAAQAGDEYRSQAPAAIQRLAKTMDDQIGHMVREGLKAGNPYAESVQGSGITGFMPQVWKWDKFGDALRNDPRAWEALRKNFTQQYVEKNVDPVLRELMDGGADAEQIAAARARLMQQVEHQVNTRMGESVRDPETRTSMDTGKFESMASELLNENFSGMAVTDKVAGEFRRLLAEKLDDRSRTEFDLLREVDGVRLLDYVEHDVVSTIQHTAHRFAGQNSMAKAGFKDYADFEALMTLATKDGATPDEVELLAFGGRAFGFMPMKAKDHPMLAALRNFTYAATMGKLGIANLADVAAVITASGVRGMFKTLGYGFRPSTELVNVLSKRGLGLVGQDYRIHSMTADVMPNGRAMVGMGAGMLRVSQKAAQLVSWVNGSNMLQRMLHKGFLPVMAEDLVGGIRGADGGMSARRMADAGLDGETVTRIRAQLEKFEAGRKEGDGFKWEDWDDQQAASKMVEAMHRITYQTFQRALVGEAAMWRSESALGSVIGQFHNFGLTSMEKQLGRNLAINDANTYTAMAVGMAWSSLLYYSRLLAGTAGMSQSDAQEYMEKNLETGRLVTGTLTYFNMSGIAAELAGMGEVVFGGNTYQAGSGPVAAMGYLGNLSRAANAAGNLATGEEGTGRHLRSILRILPGGNSLAGTYYSNILKDWE
ncbi:hypothetical protein [Bordetella bronchiseptica]|uniref:hypothetical protein n=1 Tax=Bordetella bronchiseptica TaxID=518 RepID=UPI00046186F2|nr:hypothetical protein [Bordetella bronchiseptica]KDD18693.1 hypothetical protein L522_4164 [Bordetella bronchiseptica MBORD707]